MVNKCVVTNCTRDYPTGEKKQFFLFPKDEERRKKWIYFVNRKNWTPTKYSVVCIDHFHDKFIKHGKSRCKLNLESHPVPTIHPCANSQPSFLNTPKVPRRSPRKRALLEPDDFEVFTNREKVKDFTSFTCEHTPLCHDFKRFDHKVQYYNLCFDIESGAPAVREWIIIDTCLLTYDGHVAPLPEWFRHGQNCTVTRFSMLETFASYIKQKGEECSVILKELNNIQYYQPQGRPKFSSILIRFALMLQYSSCQTYKLLLKKLPLPSMSVLGKLTSGEVDSLKVAKLVLENQTVSSDCVLIIDEMY